MTMLTLLILQLKHELMLHGQAEESGYYQCMAENEAGIDIATTYIRFKINGRFIYLIVKK